MGKLVSQCDMEVMKMAMLKHDEIFSYQLKASRLEELAVQIKSDRAKHDAKGKQVESSRAGENKKANGDQNRNDDVRISRETIARINKKKLEDELTFTDNEKHHSGSSPEKEGTGIDEDDNNDDEEMISPMPTDDIDPAVLASLPPSIQMDLLV